MAGGTAAVSRKVHREAVVQRGSIALASQQMGAANCKRRQTCVNRSWRLAKIKSHAAVEEVAGTPLGRAGEDRDGLHLAS